MANSLCLPFFQSSSSSWRGRQVHDIYVHRHIPLRAVRLSAQDVVAPFMSPAAEKDPHSSAYRPKSLSSRREGVIDWSREIGIHRIIFSFSSFRSFLFPFFDFPFAFFFAGAFLRLPLFPFWSVLRACRNTYKAH